MPLVPKKSRNSIRAGRTHQEETGTEFDGIDIEDTNESPSPAGAILHVTAGTGGIRTINDEETALNPGIIGNSHKS